MNHDVLFTPYVTVEVTEAGEVVGASVDWSDTLRNDYQGGTEVWEEGRGEEPATAKAASAYLDAAVVRSRVLAALQPAADYDPDRFKIYPWDGAPSLTPRAGGAWCVVDERQVGSDGERLVVASDLGITTAETVCEALYNVMGGPSGPTPA